MQRMLSRVLTYLAIAAFIGLPAVAQNAQPNQDNAFVWAARIMSQTNPLLDMDLDRVPLWTFDGLVDFTGELEPIGALAESWEISNEGRTYTFHLREDVTWHDGEAFTADDVVFTVETALDPENSSYMAPYFMVAGTPVEVTKIDDFTVQFDLAEPSNAFLFNMWKQNTVIVPEHVLAGEDLMTADFNLNPVGTGPYRVIRYVPNQTVIMEANPDYFRGEPKIAYWIMRSMEDQNAALAALGSQDITAVGVGGKSAREAASNMPGVDIYGYDSGWVFGMTFNTRRAPLDEKLVRQAIAYAIDREQMVSTIAGEDVTTAWSVVGPAGTWQYNDDIKTYPQDQERARELLDAAGWEMGSDGVRVKDGVPLEFEIAIQAQATDSDPMPFAVAIQDALGRVGVQVSIVQLDRASLQPRLLEDLDFDAYLWWDGYSFVPDLSAFWTTTSANPSGYASEELDALVNTANTTPDQEEREQALDQIANMVAEDVPMIPLYYYRGYVAIQDYIANVPTPSAADPNNTGIYYRVWELEIDR